MTRVVECDVCVIGAGITAAMVAERLVETRDIKIVVLEAGEWTTPLAQRMERRRRFLAYGENPWVRDHIPDQTAHGIISRSMVVGGWSMHWGGSTPRYSAEDFRVRSIYGVGDDWPIEYDEIEPFYQEAEERIGVAGEQGPPELDVRSKPYPMGPIPRSYNLERLKGWGESTGIPFWTGPVSKNSVPYRGRNVCARCDTCSICPTGAKYTPDYTFQRLIEQGRVQLFTGCLARKLVPGDRTAQIERAEAVDRNDPGEALHFRAKTFVLAGGYVWSSHLLLLSAGGRYPAGVANSSGLVGRYMHGHRAWEGFVELPVELYPGIFQNQSLFSATFARAGPMDRYVRHDLTISESSYGREPRLRDADGALLLGDEIIGDWRRRTTTKSTAYVRAIYDVLPARESALRLDSATRNRWGDPLPRVDFQDSPVSASLREHTESSITALFKDMARAGNGRVLTARPIPGQHHPGGGCRMGDDPATSVTDAHGRAHDHENLFIVGGPTAVTSGCTNSTLTFAALALRSATEIEKHFPTGDP